jgi:adenine-specific DNA-methyltransferase
MLFEQQTLLTDPAYEMALTTSHAAIEQEYGAVFTRRWVVELILDLAGYTADRDLLTLRAIEPACGDGAFLGPMVDRLVESHRRHGGDLGEATGAVRACDLQPGHVATCRALVADRLAAGGVTHADAQMLAEAWVTHDDFLLASHEIGTADFVLGNPPYIRLEAVPTAISEAYRRACYTMAGRSDVFVGFFEVGLKSLKPGGALGFICADRWMRNQYGRRLRSLVASHYSVEATIEMHDVDAFEAEVSAYPSVTVLRRGAQGRALVATTRGTFDARAAKRVQVWASEEDSSALADRDFDAAHLPGWFDGTSSWPTGSPERLALVAHLERTLPPLEDTHTRTRIGIGVATGADQVFVVKDASMVEEDRALPLAMARDTASGRVQWSGNHLIDPWDAATGRLVSLADYPKLGAYFEAHADTLLKRNVAGRRPAQWYRTIDRVDHSLTRKAKLLLPDMKATIHPVLDDGRLYPHHNLYWVASDLWDPSVLGGLMLSRVAQMFIECYAVRMRGGTLRFQAQYLRRIRVPRLDTIAAPVGRELREAFGDRDVDRATAAALTAYGLADLPA